jgi:predicted ribosomally synthesized peptide with SipW-like signal peptide
MASNANKIRTGLVTSLLTVAIATGVGAYGTFAYFNDTGESTDNLFTSGTVDVKLDDRDNVDAIVSAGNFAPGDEVSGALAVTNDGTISSYDDQDHTVKLDVAANVTQTDADGQSTDMASYLQLTTLDYGGEDQLANVSDANGNGYKDVADLDGSPLSGLDDPGSAGKNFDLSVKFHEDAGNDLQGDEVDVDFTFTLEQQ